MERKRIVVLSSIITTIIVLCGLLEITDVILIQKDIERQAFLNIMFDETIQRNNSNTRLSDVQINSDNLIDKTVKEFIYFNTTNVEDK